MAMITEELFQAIKGLSKNELKDQDMVLLIKVMEKTTAANVTIWMNNKPSYVEDKRNIHAIKMNEKWYVAIQQEHAIKIHHTTSEEDYETVKERLKEKEPLWQDKKIKFSRSTRANNAFNKCKEKIRNLAILHLLYNACRANLEDEIIIPKNKESNEKAQLMERELYWRIMTTYKKDILEWKEKASEVIIEIDEIEEIEDAAPSEITPSELALTEEKDKIIKEYEKSKRRSKERQEKLQNEMRKLEKALAVTQAENRMLETMISDEKKRVEMQKIPGFARGLLTSEDLKRKFERDKDILESIDQGTKGENKTKQLLRVEIKKNRGDSDEEEDEFPDSKWKDLLLRAQGIWNEARDSERFAQDPHSIWQMTIAEKRQSKAGPIAMTIQRTPAPLPPLAQDRRPRSPPQPQLPRALNERAADLMNRRMAPPAARWVGDPLPEAQNMTLEEIAQNTPVHPFFNEPRRQTPPTRGTPATRRPTAMNQARNVSAQEARAKAMEGRGPSFWSNTNVFEPLGLYISGEAGYSPNVCYTCGSVGHLSSKCIAKAILINNNQYIGKYAQSPTGYAYLPRPDRWNTTPLAEEQKKCARDTWTPVLRGNNALGIHLETMDKLDNYLQQQDGYTTLQRRQAADPFIRPPTRQKNVPFQPYNRREANVHWQNRTLNDHGGWQA